MREILRELKSEWPKNLDLLFILKLEVTKADYQELLSQVRRSFEKVPEALTKPPSPRKPKARKKSSVVFKNEA